jgi:HMG (high mobility group) box
MKLTNLMVRHFTADSPNYNPNGRHLPPVATSPVDIRADTVSSTEEDNFSEFARSKRKYRRHAKADKNAPIKPPSAYVMFSNQVRSELKDYNMSFTDLAKIVGDRWKSISSEEKEQYDGTALKAKEEYLEALAKYEQTDEHKVCLMLQNNSFSGNLFTLPILTGNEK